ncbi:hypothetical protein [Pseudomonas aegrilactucae]|uniref:Uncharacterized protein n=1 Tax=Pseudomonas aegrilactucae TaxID=2854028 RepID=A0A9Q2XNB3_9PSED|nr:hypothetical protein [Pseudomonas aegrilactucae]MBV6289851.1 hypothetical protein [Pseudomonas aegrilactucae]
MHVQPCHSLVVIKVEPYTADSDCAAVGLRSALGEISVFSYPCDVRVGSLVHTPLSSLDAQVQAAFLDDWPQAQKNACAVERLEQTGPYAYRGCGHVVDRAQGLISVLGFVIDVGEVPCEGAVTFECQRIDL